MVEQEKSIERDRFVSTIVEDPAKPPKALLLPGFVGDSSEPGCIRLYLNAQLSDYIEIPEEAILHTEEIPRDRSPLGGKYIWIRRDAEVIHGPVGPNRLKATYLEGWLRQVYLAWGQLPQPSPWLGWVGSAPVPQPVPEPDKLGPQPEPPDMPAMVGLVPMPPAMVTPLPIPPTWPTMLGPQPEPPDAAVKRGKEYLLRLRAWVSEYAKQIEEALSSIDQQAAS